VTGCKCTILHLILNKIQAKTANFKITIHYITKEVCEILIPSNMIWTCIVKPVLREFYNFKDEK
jgi:hypothetical protein